MDLIITKNEILSEKRNADFFRRRAQILQTAPEKSTLGEHGDRGGAILLIGFGNFHRVELLDQVAFERRAPLDFCNDPRPLSCRDQRQRFHRPLIPRSTLELGQWKVALSACQFFLFTFKNLVEDVRHELGHSRIADPAKIF